MKRTFSYSSFFFFLLAIGFSGLLTSCAKEQIETIAEETPITENSTNLLPLIGPSTLPLNTDSVYPIPFYLENDFDITAIEVGCPVPDFVLYDHNGLKYNLETILTNGKPVFIMSGNITCSVFRTNISALNDLISAYGDNINFFFVHSVESHPENDLSPYSGTGWLPDANISSGMLFDQPKTYGERVDLVNFMLSKVPIDCDVLIDGPRNDYWSSYGKATNRAYLIDETGKVVISQGWFHYTSMVASLEAYFNN